MKKLFAASAGALLGVLTAGFAGQAMAAVCPTGVALPSTNFIQFGDALSYSLPILGLDVQSSPGQINGCIIITSGSGGVLNNNAPTVVDNAYDNSQGSMNPYFQTGSPVNAPDPGGAGQFTGDTATTWDIRVSALESFLNGGVPIIYFNHNQTNSGATINQDLFIWGQIILRNDAGTVLAVFDLQAVGPIPNFGIPNGDPTTFTDTTPQGAAVVPLTDMVRARGQICLGGTGLPGSPIVPCDGSGGTVAATFNENLGANQVADAILVPELNAFLALPNFGGATVLQIDLRMGCNTATQGTCPLGSVTNNGFEQAFIVSSRPSIFLPEPGMLALLGIGFVGLLAIRRIQTSRGSKA